MCLQWGNPVSDHGVGGLLPCKHDVSCTTMLSKTWLVIKNAVTANEWHAFPPDHTSPGRFLWTNDREVLAVYRGEVSDGWVVLLKAIDAPLERSFNTDGALPAKEAFVLADAYMREDMPTRGAFGESTLAMTDTDENVAAQREWLDAVVPDYEFAVINSDREDLPEL